MSSNDAARQNRVDSSHQPRRTTTVARVSRKRTSVVVCTSSAPLVPAAVRLLLPLAADDSDALGDDCDALAASMSSSSAAKRTVSAAAVSDNSGAGRVAVTRSAITQPPLFGAMPPSPVLTWRYIYRRVPCQEGVSETRRRIPRKFLTPMMTRLGLRSE